MIDIGLDQTLAAIIHGEKPQLSPAAAATFIKKCSSRRTLARHSEGQRVAAQTDAPHEIVTDAL
jgi:hypothetical protein